MRTIKTRCDFVYSVKVPIHPNSRLARTARTIFHRTGPVQQAPVIVTSRTELRLPSLPDLAKLTQLDLEQLRKLTNSHKWHWFDMQQSVKRSICAVCRKVVVHGRVMLGHCKIVVVHTACSFTLLYQKRTSKPRPQSSAVKPSRISPLLRLV